MNLWAPAGSEQPSPSPEGWGQVKTEEERRGKGPFAGKSLYSQLSFSSLLRPVLSVVSDGREACWVSASLERMR